jgi:hypothetical protein
MEKKKPFSEKIKEVNDELVDYCREGKNSYFLLGKENGQERKHSGGSAASSEDLVEMLMMAISKSPEFQESFQVLFLKALEEMAIEENKNQKTTN